ncbi:SDR family NAD(P)-dependent oxidoreductase [Mangrovibacillus cuniculi]|uniref:SDR family oxidoreductase n=1 Tax=Mangrovibacillus cuniculi TaxID=2593652 RepID=A0A7S8CB75_9BACI|nr:SDR family oxidoreductase [Mangrovibacillus cuniculi]QPC46780.1 SDR family oxidoreductase [Mangrovibacillus cuniculi]
MGNSRIKGKHIVITGASSGIGARMAYLAAEQGANVSLVARRLEVLKELKEKIEKEFHVRCEVFSCDIANREQIKAVFKEIQSIAPVDVLVNNAGFGVFDYAHEAKEEDVEGMFDVNVLGLIACTSEVLPQMMRQKSGHIINIASQAGKMATPKSSVYAATKHAVLGYTNSLRMEVSSHGIFVTSVNPGPIATNFFEVADQSGSYVKNVERWMLKPDDIATPVIESLFKSVREINRPRWMNAAGKLYQVMPGLVEKLGGKAFSQK